MGTQVTPDARLAERIHVFERASDVPDAPRMFRDAELLVIDGVEWGADLATLRSALIPEQREFKGAFGPERTLPPEVTDAMAAIWAKANAVFATLYPYPQKGSNKSFRPMITGPEPMHFDTFVAAPTIVSFVNVSAVPRVYNIGPSFERLLADDRAGMRQMVVSCKGKLDDISYVIRDWAMVGKGPLGADTPRHRVEFAPGSIWFFDPKRVSHEVVYGEGAISFSWEVPSHAARSQRELLRDAGWSTDKGN